jgi:hypothetical protein
MKLLTVVGARPQFIKAAAVSRAIPTFNERSSRGRSRVWDDLWGVILVLACVIFQHRDFR